MDRSQCSYIVKREMPKLTKLLGVQFWIITVTYEPISDPKINSTCDRQYPQQKAVINIDPGKHRTEADILHSLRHELIHILLSPLDVYRNLAAANFEPNTPMAKVEATSWEISLELSVLAVERIFDWGIAAQDLEENQWRSLFESPDPE